MKGALATCVSVLCLATALAARAPRTIAQVDIPLDGTAISLPKMADAGAYQVRITGMVKSDIDGRRFDARYREDETGQFAQPHDLIAIEPAGGLSLQEDPSSAHTHTLGPLKGEQFGGESVTVRLDIDRLVDEFIRTPSEVRQSLSGRLQAQLLYTAPSMSPGALAVAVLAPVLLIAVVLALMIQASRRSAQRPYEDINAMRRRIQRKAALALEEIGPRDQLFDHLRRSVAELSAAAEQLAEHVVTYRSVKLQYSPRAIEEEIARLEHQLAGVSSGDVAAEYRQEIENKRKTLEYLRANEDREASYLARLSHTETTLDNLRLKLPDLRTDLAFATDERPATADVDQELALLKDAIAQTRERVMGPA